MLLLLKRWCEMLKTFALIAITSMSDGWVLDYDLSYDDCILAIEDFSHSTIFADGVVLTCEEE
jgi:hypothetical protein